MEEKKKALLIFLEEGDLEEIEEGYKENLFEIWKREYLVVNEEERKKEVTDYIKETLWAFNPSFLAVETDLPEEVFSALSEKYESGNEAILKLIEKTCGLTSFIKSAVQTDGYGHFLSGYDGTENEEEINGTIYYIYRTN